ncbi:PorA2 [Desulfamplus magnetovallimortis]|uniref:PorA2 n=1 Tax=Desulfamplus magnetovallimortis TaxID=1246637 RepID=A0A1W1H858_9BACT|nr:2-oxoacid:acceptor oxidoreductase subunit alpha [Desulfamplus magnetovallimortis]SLM28633.1 PorA2 [Desulfamplus magnetovallimortis]
MKTDITIKIGGEAGQGIQTIGTLLAEVCHCAGLYIFSVDDFESRIRGGHSFSLLRISNEPVMAPGHLPDILVAIDKRTMELNRDTLPSESMVILNSDTETGFKDNVLSIPLKGLAKEAGGLITANTVAAGAVLSLLGTPVEMLKDLMAKKFKAKGEKIINLNVNAAQKGYDAAGEHRYHKQFDWSPEETSTVVISGAKAAGLGALASDCRFFPFYPMSPATGVISSVIPYAGKLPVVVEQAEDEIAAVNMAIGASFAGVRAMTSTSGGGFCLMTEGLGLAAMTETPLVVVNAQRPGPATGLPTRTAQPDLLFVINASQDAFPRFVFAPGTPAETFRTVKKAFNLAYKYQVPAIILLDQFLATSQVTQENIFTVEPEESKESDIEEEIEKVFESFTVTDDDFEDPETYKRFELTPDGISPRAVPCMGKAIVRVTGNEHDEKGGISEDAANKIRMNSKKDAKLSFMVKEMEMPDILHPESHFMLTGWGSSRGIIIEACELLREKGADVGCIMFNDIWPMDPEQLKSSLAGKKLVMVEQNSNCQMGRLIAQETGIMYHEAILKDDGRPLYPEYIVEKASGIVG